MEEPVGGEMEVAVAQQFDREKFKDAVLFVCAAVPADTLGQVKLHKILYLADMLWYALQGRPLTGAVYRRRPFGPTADFLLTALEELEAEGRLRVEEADYFGYRKRSYTVLVEGEAGRLGADERRFLRDVAEYVCLNHTAKTISEFTHTAVWERTPAGAVIPYHTAYELIPEEDISEDDMNWAREEWKRLEDSRRKQGQVAYTDIGAFREKIRKVC